MANLNYNKVIVAGRLVNDPDVRTVGEDSTVATIDVAVNRRGQDAGADFIRVKAWDKQADFIAGYFAKGNSILVEGRLNTGSYELEDGSKRYYTEVIAERACFVDSLSESDVTDDIQESAKTKKAPVQNTRKSTAKRYNK